MHSPNFNFQRDEGFVGDAADYEELLQSDGGGIHCVDSTDITAIWSMYNGVKASDASASIMCLGSAETASSGVLTVVSSAGGGGGNGYFETQTPTRLNEGGNNKLAGVDEEKMIGVGGDSAPQSTARIPYQKEYVQQLESSHQKLTQLHQARKLQVDSGFWGEQSHSLGGRGDNVFETYHAQWLVEQERLIDNMRLSMSYDQDERQLYLLVDTIISHYGGLYQIKRAGASSDTFHILSGVWQTPVERCLMWLGGFRSSDLLKLLEKQIQPLSEQQLVEICNLKQSCQETEDALSQCMEALHQSLLHTLSSTCLSRRPSRDDVSDYTAQMSAAMSNIETMESFLNQADLLRLHTLQQLHRILSTRQTARALLAIHDYKSRLRALSSLWLARPKE